MYFVLFKFIFFNCEADTNKNNGALHKLCAALMLYWCGRIIGRFDRSVCKFLVFSSHLFTSHHAINFIQSTIYCQRCQSLQCTFESICLAFPFTCTAWYIVHVCAFVWFCRKYCPLITAKFRLIRDKCVNYVYPINNTNAGFILTAKTGNMTNRTLLCTAKIIHYIFLEIRNNFKTSGRLESWPKIRKRRARALHTQAWKLTLIWDDTWLEKIWLGYWIHNNPPPPPPPPWAEQVTALHELQNWRIPKLGIYQAIGQSATFKIPRWPIRYMYIYSQHVHVCFNEHYMKTQTTLGDATGY